MRYNKSLGIVSALDVGSRTCRMLITVRGTAKRRNRVAHTTSRLFLLYGGLIVSRYFLNRSAALMGRFMIIRFYK